jgi:hypothetical protein
MWEWLPPVYGDLGDGLWHCFTHTILKDWELKKETKKKVRIDCGKMELTNSNSQVEPARIGS